MKHKKNAAGNAAKTSEIPTKDSISGRKLASKAPKRASVERAVSFLPNQWKSGAAKPKGTAALPVASGMDFHPGRVFDAAARHAIDAVAMGAKHLVHWLNGWETAAEYLHDRDHSDPRWLNDYGGDPNTRLPLRQWTEESRDKILALFTRLGNSRQTLLDRADRPEWKAELMDPETVISMVWVDKLVEEYAVVPKVLIQPATGVIAVGYRKPGSSYAAWVSKKVWDDNYDEWHEEMRELESWPPDPEPTEEQLEMQKKIIASQGPSEGEIRAGHAVLDLARFGMLERVKRCHCSNWFYARRKDATSCSALCRQNQYDSKPEIREKKRLQAAANYRARQNGYGLKTKARRKAANSPLRVDSRDE